MADAGGIRFFYFSADDLHRAVDHAVLFGEWLRQDGKGSGQPAVGEKGGQVASLAETADLGLDDPDRLFAPLIGREIEMLVRQMLLQAVLVGNDKGNGIGTLVVIQDQLVDRGRVFGERLL